MYARFYKCHFKDGSIEGTLNYFDEQAKPMIESIDGHLGIKVGNGWRDGIYDGVVLSG